MFPLPQRLLNSGVSGNRVFSRARPATVAALKSNPPDPYATLGLHRRCTDAQIRTAYRILAKQFHPDLNQGSPDAIAKTQEINSAYELLTDPERRRDHDEANAATEARPVARRASPGVANLAKDVQLGIQELLRGTTLDVAVNDPANPGGSESYRLVVPSGTAPGARFRIRREPPFERGHVMVRVKARPDFRFKTRGSDLRCDLKITVQRAAQGGTESVRGISGDFIRIQIPPNVARGEIVRIPGEGLPKARGGRGDLLVRIVYRPEVRITRASAR